MKEEIDFTQVPFHYMLCLNQECPKAESCLRQLAEQSVPANVISYMTINPKHLATLQGECPYYRLAVKTRFAKGFIRMLESLPYKEMLEVVRILMTRFGRTAYYRIRKGQILLSPHQQQEVLRIIRRCSNSSLPEFDAYVDSYNW